MTERAGTAEAIARDDAYPSRRGGRAQMLPREDPVVYGRWHPEAPLTEEQTRAYERDGFVVLEGVFDAQELAALVGEASRLRSGLGEQRAGATITEPGSGAVRSVFEVHRQNAVMARLAADSRLAGLARFLLGDEVYIHQSRVNYKPGFRGKEFYWHSDFETWHAEDGMPRMRALSMSLSLTENTPHNGPLMLIPGSHRRYVTCPGETPENHYERSLKKQEYGVPDDDSLSALAAEGGIAAPTGPAGTLVVFDCNTMHGSNSNITPAPRSNVFLVYNAVSNALEAPFGAPAPRPEFIAARSPAPVIEPVRGRLTSRAA